MESPSANEFSVRFFAPTCIVPAFGGAILSETLRHGRGQIDLDQLRGTLELEQTRGVVLRSGNDTATRERRDIRKESLVDNSMTRIGC